MPIETRWYRQTKEIELGCCICNKFFTKKVEFTIQHYACLRPYIDLENSIRMLAETNEDAKKIVDILDEELKKADEQNGRGKTETGG